MRTRSARAVMAVTACAVLAGAGWWAWQGSSVRPESASEPAPPVAAPRTAPERLVAPVAPEVRGAAPRADEPHHEHEPAPPDPTGDLAHYDEYPMSQVPHRVVRAWGVGPGSRRMGHVSAYVVVDPGIGPSELERLARDIRDYHDGARALSVRIVDNERATYDRHVDGGDLLAESLVGRVQHSEPLGIDEIELRGRKLDDAS